MTPMSFRHIAYKILAAAALAGAVIACSTTKLLSEGEYRLQSNSVHFNGDNKLSKKEITTYIKQKSNSNVALGWSPLVNIYNFSGPNPKKPFNKLWRKLGEVPVVFDSSLVSASVSNIGKHLQYLGWYGSDVESRIDTVKRRVKVTYDVTLGKRYKISGLEYSLQDKGEFARDFMADTVHVGIYKGDWLSESTLESASEAIAARLRDRGYYGFTNNYISFEADTLNQDGTALLEMKVNDYTRNETEKEAVPHRKFHFDSVSISYPKSLKIRKRALSNLNQLHPGDIYSERAVNRTYNRMTSMKLFSVVNVGMTPTDTNSISCNISMMPSKLKGAKINFEASTNSNGMLGFVPELSYYNKNIFHGGEWFNITFMGNFQFKPKSDMRSTELGASASLSFPKFLFLPYRMFPGAIPRTEIKVSYNFQSRPEYTRHIASVAYTYTGTHKKLWYQFSPVQASLVRLVDINETFYNSLKNNAWLQNSYMDHLDIGAGVVLMLSSTMQSNPKTDYRYIRLTTNLSGNILSLFNPLMKVNGQGSRDLWGMPYAQYVKAELSLVNAWRFGKDNGQTIAMRLLGGFGYAYGNSDMLPFEQRFYAGGANSMRAWQARAVGPGNEVQDKTFVIPNQSGDIRLEANIEYRFDMFWKLAGAVFVDAGNVWTREREGGSETGVFNGKKFFQSIAADWGLGLRIDLNFLLLRFDAGMKMYDPSRSPNHRWIGPDQWHKTRNIALHFGVGYPF